MKTVTLYTVLLCVASTGFIAWRVHALRNNETPHFEIVEDVSGSHGVACESLLGLAEEALQSDGTAPGSTLTVLVLGDQSTANEPWLMGTYPIPTIRKALEGRSEITRRRSEILAELQKKCRLLRQTTISPIFLGVKQAVADLRARGCGEASRCRLIIDSDLEENVEPSIKKNVNRTTDNESVLPLPVANKGIDVAFCGLAVTTGRLVDSLSTGFRKGLPRTPVREDRLRETWQSLFTDPAVVNFDPYCPKFSSLAAYAASPSSVKDTLRP